MGFVNEPNYFELHLGDLPENVTVHRTEAPADLFIIFASRAAEAERGFERAMTMLPADGSIWVAWPKKSSGEETDIDENILRDLFLPTGMVDNKVCAIDDTWSGLRFVVRKENRPGWVNGGEPSESKPGSPDREGELMTELEQRRLVNHRLSVLRHAEEVTGNVAGTCRYYGISRQTFYKWLRRYEEQGLEGLRDRSSRPHHSPNATSAEVVGKIMYLRQHYHFGPQKIAMYLKRYHDIDMSPSGVWRILKRLDMNRLPASQKHKTYQKRWKRYEKPQPGHAVQVDVKFITPVGAAAKRFYQFTAIDDCTRLRVLKAYPRCNQKTAIQFLDYLLARLPFRVEVIQTDHGGEFGTQFHYHVLDRGIRHVYIKPATPRLNGKVERSHRIDEEEFYRMLDGIVIDTTELFNDKLQEWENFYNFNRPHGGLDGQTPYERLKQKTTENPAV